MKLIKLKNNKKIQSKLQTLSNLGINYVTLGESTPSLSGGEAQRLKIDSQNGRNQDDSIFIFDEPSIGFHPKDIKELLNIFYQLINNCTIVVIEYDLDIIKNSNYIIGIGPDGGVFWGKIVSKGTVEDI